MAVLHAKRISLDWGWPPNDTEIGTVVGWLNDPDVTRYSEQRHKIHTFDTQMEYLANLDTRDIYARIYLDDRHKMVGVISADIDRSNLVADVGILLGDRSIWGKGYGYEAWTTMLDLLKHLKIFKIEAGCMAANEAMMNICKRSGMIEEGRRRDHFLVNGTRTDLVYWGKINETIQRVHERRGRQVA